MKAIAVNGSPRKNWNTATLLKKALKGAASQGAETELINLYDHNYKGCTSCFACKLKGGPSYGKCAVSDDLKPILAKIEQADVLILGSPVYFGMPSGEMKSFLERLLFQYLVYDANYSTLLKKRIKTGFIYTMNVGEARLEIAGYDKQFKSMEMTLTRFFGSSETLVSTDTYQFDDYSKYIASAFNAEAKLKRRNEVFPKDCQKAYDMGARFAKNS